MGFHARNLQVAVLDQDAWNALDSAGASESPSESRSELEEWNQEIDPNATDSDIPQAVRSLMVNISQICNLKCAYCAAGGDGSFGDPVKHIEIETVYEQIRMLLHDIPNGASFSLTFFGGEPLVAPESIRLLARFVKLQTAGREIDTRFCLITNATLVTPEIAELLASIQCHVTVSFDGSPEVHDRARQTRGGRGSSIAVLKGLDRLIEVRPRLGSLSVGSVFGKHNTAVLDAYKYLREFNFDSYKFDFAAEAGDSESSRAYATELARTAEFAFAHGGEAELRKIAVFDSLFTALDSQKRLNNHCGAGKSMLTIDGRGRVTTCQWFVGQKDEEVGFGTDLDHAKLARFASRLNELNDCGACWARHLCGGGCMYVNQVKTGQKHRKDADFCHRMRSTAAKAIETYAEARYQNEGGDGHEAH